MTAVGSGIRARPQQRASDHETPARLQRTDGDAPTGMRGHFHSPSLGPRRPLCLAWSLMIGSLVGFWCCRPWLSTRAFGYGATRCLPPDVEDCVAGLSAGRGVGASHPPPIAGLLLLVRDAAAAVSRGPGHSPMVPYRRCPESFSTPWLERRCSGWCRICCRPRPRSRSASGSRWNDSRTGR